MKLTNIIFIVAVTASLAWRVTAQTNEPSGSVHFQNVPLNEVAGILATLKAKPIVMNQSEPATSFSFEGKFTRQQFVEKIETRLHENGRALVNVNDKYFKLVDMDETNKATDCPHLLIEIQTNSITLDSQSISLKALPDAIKQRLTPTTEIWLHDARPRQQVLLPGAKVTGRNKVSVYEISRALSDAKIPREIFEAYFPRK